MSTGPTRSDVCTKSLYSERKPKSVRNRGVSCADAPTTPETTVAWPAPFWYVATQAASITQLTAEKAAISDRLDVCIATADRYRSYTADNVKTMQGISDKWGANYSVPLKGVFTSLAAAADQLICS